MELTEGMSVRIMYPSLLAINYVTSFKCSNGCDAEKCFQCLSFKITSFDVPSVQSALDDFFLSKALNYCSICKSNIATDSLVSEYSVPKLFIIDTSYFSNGAKEKRLADFEINDTIYIKDQTLTLFAVIYIINGNHFISRHFRTDEKCNKVHFSYNGFTTGGN
jgi:hypothetical protein